MSQSSSQSVKQLMGECVSYGGRKRENKQTTILGGSEEKSKKQVREEESVAGRSGENK